MTQDTGNQEAAAGQTVAAPVAVVETRRRRSRLVPGIPRRRRGAPEPRTVQVLRGLATVGVAFVCMLAGFLVGLGLAELTGTVEILMAAAIGGIVVGSLFAQRAANWIMDWIA